MKLNYIPNSYVLTVDIGGTHLTAAICHIETFSVIEQTKQRIEFDSTASAKRILSSWTKVLSQLISSTRLPARRLAIAMPGPFDYNSGISYIKGLAKYENLYGLNIKSFLSEQLGLEMDCVLFRNDAEATIAGEMVAGAGRSFKQAVGITLGTGFGSACFKNDVAWDINLGSHPFRTTIADDHLSTRWFLKRFYELTGMKISGVKELAEIADTNRVARDIFTEFSDNLIEFLQDKLPQYQPEALIICGNIANAHRFFKAKLERQLQYAVKLAELGENAALLGAAALFEVSEKSIDKFE